MEILIYLIVYLALGTTTAFITWKLSPNLRKKDILDDPGLVFVGVGWPVAAPVLGTYIALKGLTDVLLRLKMPRFGRRTPEQRAIEYAQAPVNLMAGLIASKIEAYPEGMDTKGGQWKSKDKTIKVSFYSGLAYHLYSLRFNGKDITLTAEGAKTVLRSIKKTYEFAGAKQKAEEEKKKQLEALDIVEQLLLTPEKGPNHAPN